MTANTTLRPPPPAAPARVAALPNPPKPLDAMHQSPHIFKAYAILENHLKHRPDMLVGARGYLCYDTRDHSPWAQMDCVVAFGVDPDAIFARNGYVISEVGKPPDFVLEVASESTGRRDYTTKRAIYAEYGVAEYWRFDRSGGQYHDRPLIRRPPGQRPVRTTPAEHRRGRSNPGLQPGAGAGATLGCRPAAVLRPDRRVTISPTWPKPRPNWIPRRRPAPSPRPSGMPPKPW